MSQSGFSRKFDDETLCDKLDRLKQGRDLEGLFLPAHDEAFETIIEMLKVATDDEREKFMNVQDSDITDAAETFIYSSKLTVPTRQALIDIIYDTLEKSYGQSEQERLRRVANQQRSELAQELERRKLDEISFAKQQDRREREAREVEEALKRERKRRRESTISRWLRETTTRITTGMASLSQSGSPTSPKSPTSPSSTISGYWKLRDQ